MAEQAQGVGYDTAFRGVHHQRLMRDLGWVSVNCVTANAGSRERPAKDRKRVEKTVYVETKTIRTPDGEQQVRLISQGGRIGLGEVLVTASAQHRQPSADVEHDHERARRQRLEHARPMSRTA